MNSWKTTLAGLSTILSVLAHIAASLQSGTPIDFTTAFAGLATGVGLIFARDNNRTSEEAKAPAASATSVRINVLLLALVAIGATGCHSIRYDKASADGAHVSFSARSLFSNSVVKGLTVEGTTKTTTNGLRITSTATEPNPESITATGAALGELIGTAAKAAAK